MASTIINQQKSSILFFLLLVLGVCFFFVSSSKRHSAKSSSIIESITAFIPVSGSTQSLRKNTKMDAVFSSLRSKRIAARNRKYQNYRLGDVVLGHITFQNRHEYSSYSMLVSYYQKEFPGTIATEYLLDPDKPRTNNNEHLLDPVFLKIINSRLKNILPMETPSPTSAVVHLRLGDVMFNASDQWMYDTVASNNLHYVFPMKYYETVVLPNIPKNIRSIVLTGNTYHWATDRSRSNAIRQKHQDESLKYVALISKYFEAKGFEVTKRINKGTPDEDFLFMVGSRLFVRAGGGYSRLVGKIVSQRRGLVL